MRIQRIQVVTLIVVLAAGTSGFGVFFPGLNGRHGQFRAEGTVPSVAPRNGDAMVAPGRPNIVLVMADDMRADDLRFMPDVRRLIGQRGLRFRNSFSPYPLCCPARASLLTGLYAHNHRVFSNLEPWGFAGFDDRVTLATSLRAAGYQTTFIGKYLNGYGSARSRVTGRSSLHYVPAGWTDWHATLDLPMGSRLGGGTYDYFDTVYNVNGKVDKRHRGEYQTETLGRFARARVRDYAGSGRPFFLYLSALAPHSGLPHEPDDSVWTRDSGQGLRKLATPARPRWVRGHFDRLVTRGPGVPADGSPPEPDVSDKPRFLRNPPLETFERKAIMQLTRQRAEALLVLDRQISRLVATLKRQGILDRTILMFTSDNGYFLGEHRFRFAKTLAYEPSLRVPLLVAGPGVPVGTRFDPVQTPDLTATILDLAQAQAPHPSDGSSLSDRFDRGDRGWSAPVITEALVWAARPASGDPRIARQFNDARTMIGIRTSRYKFIRWITGAVELYDLRDDPNELVNRARDPAFADLRRDLQRVLVRYKDCSGSSCIRSMANPALQVGAKAEAALTRRQARGVRAKFGVTW